MGRPYGVGFYGAHRYSRGSYVRLASVAQAAAEAQANAVRVRGAWAEVTAVGAAYARQPDTLTDRAAFLRGDVSAAAGAGITLDRATTERASSRSWAGLDRIRTFRAGARASAASLAQSETTLGSAVLLNAVGDGYAVQPDTMADRAAFSETQTLSRALPGKLALSMVYEAARTTTTTQAEVDFSSAAHLSAQASAYTSGRFAWEGGGGVGAGPWVLQPAGPGRLWRPQGERPPRPYGRGRYSAGMYSTNPPILVDRWSEV